jgi:hypothetical protein
MEQFFLQRRTVNINQLRGILPDLLITCNKEDGGCRRTGSQMIIIAKKKLKIISVMEGGYNITKFLSWRRCSLVLQLRHPFRYVRNSTFHLLRGNITYLGLHPELKVFL